MEYVCIYPFTGAIGGVEKRFTPGDKITADEANELNLAAKPDLAEPAKKGKA